MANELLKAQIEAALFLTEKPLRAQAVATIVNAEVNLVRQMILELIRDYEARNGGLEVSDDDGYIIQVKDEYTNLVDEFVPIDMPTALIRTLSAIAIKQPVMQSEIIKLRGAGAYDHIKDLLARELIMKREDGGRSPILTTTKKFQEYFRLSKDGKSFRQQMSGELKAASRSNEQAGESDVAADGAAIASAVAEGGVPVAAESDGNIAIESDVNNATGDEVKVGTDGDVKLATEGETNTAVFDASPDPSTPPIGTAGDISADDATSSETSNGDVTAEDADTTIDLKQVILEDTDTESISKISESIEAAMEARAEANTNQ